MIRLTKLALQRPVTVILCLVTIAYFGFQSLIGARMELIPENGTSDAADQHDLCGSGSG